MKKKVKTKILTEKPDEVKEINIVNPIKKDEKIIFDSKFVNVCILRYKCAGCDKTSKSGN